MAERKVIPGLIRRETWGAREPDGFGDRPLPLREWWLHHSVTIAPDLVAPFTDDDAAIRELERIGQDRFSGGISYTVLITPVGRAYEGHSIGRRGAHTVGHNSVAGGICLVGNYSTHRPTEAQLDAVAWVMVKAHRAGLATTHQLNGGHRDVKDTECPGSQAYRLIAEINRRARKLWAAPTQEDDDMPTAQEIADALLNSPVPDYSKPLNADGKRETITLRVAIGSMRTSLLTLRQKAEETPSQETVKP